MTPPIYPAFVMEQNLAPDHFGSDIDDICEEIHSATKGWGANKQKVIDALAPHDATRRMHIAIRYKELYEGQDLSELMKKEFSGDFGFALKLLALPLDWADAAVIRKATARVGANSKLTWSVMVGRTNEEMELLKKTYFKKYDQDLGKVIGYEFSGDMERLLFNCMQAAEEKYDPQFHTSDKAVEDAEIIHAHGQGRRFGTNEREIFKVLCASPKEHLEAISAVYADKYGYTLWKAMEKELSGEVKNAVVYLIGTKTKPYEAMARLVKESCAGFGTDEVMLTSCIIRYQSILTEVQSAHIELYGKTIHDRVRDEVGGKYKSLLLKVLNAVWPEEG